MAGKAEVVLKELLRPYKKNGNCVGIVYVVYVVVKSLLTLALSDPPRSGLRKYITRFFLSFNTAYSKDPRTLRVIRKYVFIIIIVSNFPQLVVNLSLALFMFRVARSLSLLTLPRMLFSLLPIVLTQMPGSAAQNRKQ